MYFITIKRMLEVCFSAHPNIQYRALFMQEFLDHILVKEIQKFSAPHQLRIFQFLHLSLIIPLNQLLDLRSRSQCILQRYVMVQGIDDCSDKLAHISFYIPVTFKKFWRVVV